MKEEIIFKKYTISDLKAWLFHNEQNGISSIIISKNRALALIENPDALDNDVVLSVIYVDEKIAGFTAVFSEMFVRPISANRFVWGTTIFIDPQFRGRGLGFRLMKNIQESNNYQYLGIDIAEATARIVLKLDSKIFIYDRFKLLLEIKRIEIKGLKSLLYLMLYFWKFIVSQIKNRQVLRKIIKQEFNIEYVNYIDDTLYDFIKRHSSNNIFLRSQEKFNWIMRYSFILSAPCLERVKQEYEFSSVSKSFESFSIKVFYHEDLIGFYVFSLNDRDFVLLYVYFNPNYSDKVFASITEHILRLKCRSVKTFQKEIKLYFHKIGFMSVNNSKEKVSLILPKDFEIDENFCVQGGDGDMLT